MDTAPNPFLTASSAVLTLHLQAPPGAGVRFFIDAWLDRSTVRSLTIGGQAFALPDFGFPVFATDAVVPPGGLDVQVQMHAHTGAGSLLLANSSLDLTWEYPGVQAAGAASPGCLGPAVCWTNGLPRLGNSSFGFLGSNAHPGLGGFMALSFGGLAVPISLAGVDLWLDPSLPNLTSFVSSNAVGDLLYALPLPSHPSFVGTPFWAQFLLLEPTTCMPAGLSGSNAVRVDLLP